VTAFRICRVSGLALVIGAIAACGGGEHGADCTPGQSACVCRPSDQCDDGLACVDGRCAAASEVAVTVSDPAARSCEALLDEHAAHIVGVRFAPSVTGTHLREAPNSAVAFFVKGDTAIAGDAVTLRVVADATTAIEVRQARCFGRAGELLANATVRVGR
jgi:hypothetical protein